MDLSVDQIRIVNNKIKGHSVIKGVAGSGKTTVALFKLAVLQKEELKNEKVLVVTYNSTLKDYMQYLCHEYGVVLNNNKVHIRTIDSIIYSLCKKEPYNIIKPAEQRELMQLAMQKVRQHYNNSVIQNENVQFILEEVDWIQSCRYLTKEKYMSVDRLGRNSIGENHVRLAKQSENRAAIFDVFLEYEQLLEKKNLTDYKTNAIRALSKIKKGEIKPEKYSYIIVDESQDLSRVQLELIRELYNESDISSITFISDVAQSIYSQSWLSKQSFKSIGFDMSGKSNILFKNYRTTKQIALAAYSLINNDKELKSSVDYVEPESLERNGYKPVYRHFEDQEKEFFYITTEIKKCIKQFELKDIVVVARESNYLKELKIYFLNHGVDAVLFKDLKSDNENSFCVDKVKLFTLHSIKGLEASVVFIVGINDGILPFSQDKLDVERKLLYVGMTRGKELLYLTSSKKESVYIHEILPQYLQLSDDETEDFFDISIEKYQFINQKKNTEEEGVRQWYLNLLQTKYGYSLQRIEIEASVKYGSKSFFVDIVVYEENDKENPFIYVETKKHGENLFDALKQVKSYILPGNAPQYIVVTDGKDRIIEKYQKETGKYIKCGDIPVYDSSESWSDIIQYHDFIDKKTIRYKYVEDEKGWLQDITEERKLEVVYLPVKGSVAAGNLKYVNVEYDKKEMLPVEAIKDSDMKFVLEVSGDSMIDFGILDGDRIVVKKQSFAKEGSIIVGGNIVMNEATVKQFHYDGEDNVILHPGNKKYQDIVIKVEDFYINGIVVGIVRRMK